MAFDIDSLTRECPQFWTAARKWNGMKSAARFGPGNGSRSASWSLARNHWLKPTEAELHQAMLSWIRNKGLTVLNWTPQAEQCGLRLVCAAQWLPE